MFKNVEHLWYWSYFYLLLIFLYVSHVQLCQIPQEALQKERWKWRWLWSQSQSQSSFQCLWTCTPSTHLFHWLCPCLYAPIYIKFCEFSMADILYLKYWPFLMFSTGSSTHDCSTNGQRYDRCSSPIRALGVEWEKTRDRCTCLQCRWGHWRRDCRIKCFGDILNQ